MNGVRTRVANVALVLLLLVVSNLLGCSVILRLAGRDPGRVGHSDQASKAAKKKLKEEFKPKKLHQRAHYRLRQLDAIHRETWWVINGQRGSVGISPFGRLARAVQTEFLKEPLARKFTKFCETYQVSWQKKTLKSLPQEWQFFEKCKKTAIGEAFAQIELLSKDHWRIQFVASRMASNFGLIASIRARRISCEVKFDAKTDVVQTLTCEDWHHDVKQNEVLRLETFKYSAKGPFLIEVVGTVFRDLNDPIRKLVGRVPIEGKGQVVETELPTPLRPGSSPAYIPGPLPPPGAEMAKAPDDKSGGTGSKARGSRVVDPKDVAGGIIGRGNGERRNAIVGPDGQLVTSEPEVDPETGEPIEDSAAQSRFDEDGNEIVDGDESFEGEDPDDPNQAGTTAGEELEEVGQEFDEEGNPIDLVGEEDEQGYGEDAESPDGENFEEEGLPEGGAANPGEETDPRGIDPRDVDPRGPDPRDADPRYQQRNPRNREHRTPPSPPQPRRNSEPDYIEGGDENAGGVILQKKSR